MDSEQWAFLGILSFAIPKYDAPQGSVIWTVILALRPYFNGLQKTLLRSACA